ncbi:hypothetical protein EXIGLDRAFT_300702 [Exidia glandulosa HHB12029]|uniref:Uncharacterized protein n=1 Tax=Exidia glandulosa HHB12029 TaxID=1314781 RepID=A0A165D8I8_EXIGL|nr:hypothetical protein EXIGLDRAFT_300702 [Exidia glandulosa HHB12029]
MLEEFRRVVWTPTLLCCSWVEAAYETDCRKIGEILTWSYAPYQVLSVASSWVRLVQSRRIADKAFSDQLRIPTIVSDSSRSMKSLTRLGQA